MKKNKKELSKKYLLIRGSILLIVGFISLFAVIYFNIKKDDNPFSNSNKISDAVKFKQEYENLNNVLDDEGNKKYINIKIEKDNPIIYSNSTEIIDVIKNKDGVILFSTGTCPWSRHAIPVLIDAAKETNTDKIYYLDISNMQNELELDSNNNIITKKEGTRDYLSIIELLNDYLPAYDGLMNDSIKRIYTPTVVFVKNGEVLGIHEKTVGSHSNAKITLSDEQYDELKQIYIDYMNKINEDKDDN